MSREPMDTLEASAGRRVYSVSRLTREIKLHLERAFVGVWVEGELSNCRRPSSGHLYCTLKDDRSQLPAVMFRSAQRHLRFQPADGLAVLARGHITLYEPRGSYQLQIEWLEPRGKGALQLAFEQLKEKLSQEGLFAPERKRALPLLPQRIGVVTSPSGAAIRDVCRILHRRFPNLEVVVYPTQVQGELAAYSIAKGIQVMNRIGGFDVLILCRGGGSLEDLWPFNEESVARAIASSAIPVISAVGHEVDFTISDFVADVRAPTPSAAAEIVVSRKELFRERVSELDRRVGQFLARAIGERRARIERLAEHRAFLAVRHAFQMVAQQVDEASLRLDGAAERRIGRLRARLDAASRRLETLRLDRQVSETKARLSHLASRLAASERARLAGSRERLARSASRLDALSPLGVLGRGYSLAWDSRGRLLRDAAGVVPGDRVRVTLHRGELDCRVERSRPESEESTDRWT